MSIEINPIPAPRSFSGGETWIQPLSEAYLVADLDEIDFHATVVECEATAAAEVHFFTSMQNTSPTSTLWTTPVTMVQLTSTGVTLISLPGSGKKLMKYLWIHVAGVTASKRITLLLQGLGRRKTF